ncbi:class I SAM-dependent methyltransferase [Erythrobacter sp. NE805]|uniref:class I SAM-dependent methyltransferase n=1 Tax=Erythrobacter sp. NE805 TaxID=3389875 RepID=UPI00396AF850
MQDLATSDAGGAPCGDEGLEDCAACLMCGGTAAELALDGAEDLFFRADPGRFAIHRCRACGSLWLPRRPAGERLVRAYSGYHTHNEHADPTVAPHPLREWIRAAYYRSLFPGIAGPLDRLVGFALAAIGYDTSGLDKELRFVPPPPARVLDYGCGGGRFFRQLRGLPFKFYGVEYDPHLLSALAAEGIEVEDTATITDDRWDREFDYITLAHVLEHVPDPLALLRRLFGWLKPGGALYVELPNAGASGLAIFGAVWRGLEVPRHFALPTRAALARALEETGFVIERQVIDPAARDLLWGESLAAAPERAHAALRQAMAGAPPETPDNAELLIFIARRPAA